MVGQVCSESCTRAQQGADSSMPEGGTAILKDLFFLFLPKEKKASFIVISVSFAFSTLIYFSQFI